MKKVLLQLLHDLKQNDFIRNIAKTITGGLLVKLIGFLSIAIIARLYSPEEFGILEFAVSIQLIAITFTSFKYDQAIIVAKEEESAINLFALSMVILTIISIIIVIITFFVHKYIIEFESILELGNLIYFIPFFILLRGFRDNLNSWSLRKKRFGRSVFADIINKLGEVIFKIILSGLGIVGLFLGTTVGLFSTCIILLYFMLKIDIKSFQNISFSQMKANFIKYKNFPMFLMPSHLFRMVSDRLPALILNPFFGFEIVGYYSISYKLFNEPLAILGKSIGDVFYQETSKRHIEQRNIKNLVYQVFEKLFIMSFLPILILTISGKLLISVFLGDSWDLAGYYTQILAPMIFFRLISNTTSSIFNVFAKQYLDMIFNALLLTCGLTSLIIGGILNSASLGLTFLSASHSVVYLLSIITILSICKISFLKLLKNLFIPFILAIVAIVIYLLLIKFIINNNILQILLCVIISGLYYLTILFFQTIRKKIKEET